MQQKRWGDLSVLQRALIMLGGILQLGLLGATLFDLRRRPAELIRGPKKLWFGLAFVNYIGPIAYFTIGRRREMSTKVLQPFGE